MQQGLTQRRSTKAWLTLLITAVAFIGAVGVIYLDLFASEEVATLPNRTIAMTLTMPFFIGQAIGHIRQRHWRNVSLYLDIFIILIWLERLHDVLA